MGEVRGSREPVHHGVLEVVREADTEVRLGVRGGLALNPLVFNEVLGDGVEVEAVGLREFEAELLVEVRDDP